MVRDEKLQKDRKILRKIDLNLASQSLYLVAANVLVFLFIATVGGYYVVHARVTVLAALCLLFLSMGTMYLSMRFESTVTLAWTT